MALSFWLVYIYILNTFFLGVVLGVRATLWQKEGIKMRCPPQQVIADPEGFRHSCTSVYPISQCQNLYNGCQLLGPFCLSVRVTQILLPFFPWKLHPSSYSFLAGSNSLVVGSASSISFTTSDFPNKKAIVSSLITELKICSIGCCCLLVLDWVKQGMPHLRFFFFSPGLCWYPSQSSSL